MHGFGGEIQKDGTREANDRGEKQVISEGEICSVGLLNKELTAST